ncbi:hypothetical protein G4Y73_10530 [Wenzhouxiangella sp. XN201]|uniref:hypothetical protein n=1 Tax=Wenzhouxiangella sp. XN201 TaxID=2710755 RepID=UPI0013C5D7C4|nr:hypothetical protein [Wenzhouxiangella sp. XN201]NEZ04585.1 hypothetical protein [Wenzhouxiangella sp. XN201]
MKNPLAVRCTFAAVILATMAGAFAQSGSDLILKTEPEDTIIPLAGNVAIDSSGNIITTPVDTSLVCSAGALCDDVAVSAQTFTVDGSQETTVSQGQTVLLEWTSRGAWECEGFDFPGWTGIGKPPISGGVRIDTDGVPIGTYEPALLCHNGSVQSDTLTATINVEGASEETSHCTNREQLPSTWKQRTYGSRSCIFSDYHSLDTTKDCRFFDGIWPADWPGTSNQRVLNLGPGNGAREYVAIAFNSGSITTDVQDQISFNSPQTGGLDMNDLIYTISTCPADFDKPAVDEEMGPGCYVQRTGRFNLLWGGTDWVDHQSVCGLQPNTDYYLNVIYSSSPVGTPPSALEPIVKCTEGNGCGHRMTP